MDERKEGTTKMKITVKEKEHVALASDTRFSAALFSAVANGYSRVGDILRAAGAYLSDEVLQSRVNNQG